MSNAMAWLAVAWVIAVVAATPLPIVLLHGIDSDISALEHLGDVLKAALPGVTVVPQEIGDGRFDSILWNADKQVDFLCKTLAANPVLRAGCNIMAVSLGAVMARGFVERCDVPTVRTFVTWVGPQSGVDALPMVFEQCDRFLPNRTAICDFIANQFEKLAYTAPVQAEFSFAGFWKDPTRLEQYAAAKTFLWRLEQPDAAQKAHFSSLEHLVVVHSLNEGFLQPPVSTTWGYYRPGTRDPPMLPMEAQPFYIDDAFGLRTLNEAGRVHRFNTTCKHEDYVSPQFDIDVRRFAVPYLS